MNSTTVARAKKFENKAIGFEMDKSHAPDARRVIRDERVAVTAARLAGHLTEDDLTEAERVWSMWQNY